MNRLEAGAAVERYVVEGLLGEGSTAAVYKVRDPSSGQAYALKVLTTDSTTIRRRMLQEGKIQFQLTHPNVVGVIEVLDIDGQAGLLMEFVRGPTLADLLRSYRPSEEEAVYLFGGILSGVQAAHHVGLIHRDLKPENVLLAQSSSGVIPKVTDFGIAKAPGEPDKRSTRPGVAMGTPSYMSPEQVRDASSADVRSDVFALGAILYELATGRVAFDGDSVFDIMRKVVDGSYKPPKELRPDIDTRIASTINGCLRVNPDSRLQDCNTVAAVLAGVAMAREVSDVLPDRVPPGSPMVAVVRGLAHSTPAPADQRASTPRRNYDSLEPPEDQDASGFRDASLFGSIVDFDAADERDSQAGPPDKLVYGDEEYSLPGVVPGFDDNEAQPTVIDVPQEPRDARPVEQPRNPFSASESDEAQPTVIDTPPEPAPPPPPRPAPADDWEAAPTVVGDDDLVQRMLPDHQPEELELDLEGDTGDEQQTTVVASQPPERQSAHPPIPSADDEQQTTVVGQTAPESSPLPRSMIDPSKQDIEQQTTLVAPPTSDPKVSRLPVDAPQQTQPPKPTAPKKSEWKPGESGAPTVPSGHSSYQPEATGTQQTTTVRKAGAALALSAVLGSGGLLVIAVIFLIIVLLYTANTTPPEVEVEPVAPLEPTPSEMVPDEPDEGDEADALPSDEADGAGDDEAGSSEGAATTAPARANPQPTNRSSRRPATTRPRPEPTPDDDLFDEDGGDDDTEITFDDLDLPPPEMLDPPGRILIADQKGRVEFRAPGERYGVGDKMPPGRYDIYADFGKDDMVHAGSIQLGSGETMTLECKNPRKGCE